MAKLKDGYLKYITANTPGSDSYALLAGGGYLSYSNSGGANTLVQRDAYGYIVNNYFYTSTGGAERNASGLGYIAGFNSSDYYIRSYTSDAVKTWLGLGTNAYSSTAYLPLTGGTLTNSLGFNSNYIIKPFADFRTTSDVYTGALTVTLPANISNTMVSMWIDVYNYSTDTSFSVHVGGYTYNNSTWSNNPFGMVYGADHVIRLGHNGTNFVIHIGETNTTWHYPQVTVRNVTIGYNPSYSNWMNSFVISFATTLSTVTATLYNKAWTSKNLTNVSQLTNNSGYITSSASITGAASHLAIVSGGSSSTWNWSGPGGQPTWLWGSNDGTNMYVYNPSNFSVNYASTSGSTSTLDYGGLQTMDTSGTLTQGTKFYGVYNNGYPTMYGNVLNIAGQGYGQLLIGWSETTGAHADNYIRSLRDSAKGTNGWSDWAKILTSANYGSYAIPLSGGTITGSLTVSSTLTANSGIELYGATPYIDFHFNNSASDYTSRIVESTSGTLTTTGAFKVNGATTLSSTLGVTGLTTLGGGLLVSSGGININDSGLWWKDSAGTTVYSNITSNSSAVASWQVIDANGTEIWFGKRGGKRILSMVTQYDTVNNVSTASYTTIGFGTSIAQRNYTLQVNGTLNTQDSIYSDGGLSVVGGITSSSGSLNVLGGVTAGGNVSANEGYFTGMVQASGKIRAYGGDRGDMLTLLFDGYYGYDTVNNVVVSTNYVNRTRVTPTFARTAAGVYTLTFSAPTYISTILLCIVKDATNFFYVSSNISVAGNTYTFTFQTANDNSRDDAVFRVSMLYQMQ